MARQSKDLSAMASISASSTPSASTAGFRALFRGSATIVSTRSRSRKRR